MSKVITFSRTFPAYHPRAGEPTYFVEKLWNSLRNESFALPSDFTPFVRTYELSMPAEKYFESFSVREIKSHTIRAGHRFKVGDKFSPRVWSGKPYNSKQIILAPDIEVVKVFSFDKDLISKDFYLNGMKVQPDDLITIAANDGLSLSDMLLWFKYPKPFNGQIICWNKDINY